MPPTGFNADAFSHNDAPGVAEHDTASYGSTDLTPGCAECGGLRTQLFENKRALEELANENGRSYLAVEDLKVEVAALKDSARNEKDAAADAAEQLRVERDTAKARLESVESENQHLRSCQSSEREDGRRNTESLMNIRAQKGSLEAELSSLKTRLEEALHETSSSHKNEQQLRLQMASLEKEAIYLRARVAIVEKEKSAVQDQLGQRTEELEARNGQSSSLLREKDETLQNLQADLNRNNCDLTAALEQVRHFQGLLHTQTASTQQFQDELDRVHRELGNKDASNEKLEDRRFDAEVALLNSRRAFEETQKDLVERTQEAEQRSRCNEDLLTKTLGQMSRDREEYQFTISTKPEAEFLLLRVVLCEDSRIRLRDTLLSLEDADDFLNQLELANHDLAQYVFFVGMARQKLPRGYTTFSAIREGWQLRQVLWVLPISYQHDAQSFWSENPSWNSMSELEHQGFAVQGGKLVYSNSERPKSPLRPMPKLVSSSADMNSPDGYVNVRKRKSSDPRKRIEGKIRSRSPSREVSVRGRNQIRSPRGKGQVGPIGGIRKTPPTRSGIADRLRRLPSKASGSNMPSTALQLISGAQAANPRAGPIEEESMQTVERIEDLMEDE